tara:strand:- start:454 stop:684 length:231 start_codon:yes stop_codon:yes gene_type:complete
MKTIENNIREVMATVFECDHSQINSLTSPDTLESWDSIRHMNLVVAVEEKFDIELSSDQIDSIVSYESLVHVISRI